MKHLQKFKIIINQDHYDEEDFTEDLDCIKSLLGLRDFHQVFHHEILIEKELVLLLGTEVPKPKPFFEKVKWEDIEPFKDKINNFEKIDFEKLKISESTINEINSLFNSSLNFSLNNSKKLINNEKVSNRNDESKKSYGTKKDNNTLKKASYENTLSNLSDFLDEDNNSKSNDSNKKEDNFPINFIKQDDFRIDENIENIKYNYYIPDNNNVGTLFEGDVTNCIYDIFNLLTMGNLIFYRNITYKEDNKNYEFDFQICNIKFTNFLYFLGLFLPNIPSLDTLKIDVKTIFKDKERIFENIDNFKMKDGKEKEYENIDILGEITLDLPNIDIKKKNQINNYIKLIKKLKEKPQLNKKFHFSEKNKKIILIITDGKFEQFYNYIKYDNKLKILEKDKIDHIYIYVKSKNSSDSIGQKKIIYQYINLLEKMLSDKSNNIIRDQPKMLDKIKSLKISEIYSNFYEKVIYSKKYDLLHQKIKKINSKYLQNIPNEYINFLKKNITKTKRNEIIESFMKQIKPEIKLIPKNIDKIKKEFNNIKEKIKPALSILEFSSYELKYDNYNKNDLNISKYSGKKYDYQNNSLNAQSTINNWLTTQKDNYQKIMIYDTCQEDFFTLDLLSSIKTYLSKDITFIFTKNIEQYCLLLRVNQNIFFFSNKEELHHKLIDIEKENKYKYYLLSKLSNQFSLYDKILKNKIIIDDKNLSDNYFQNFITKINQNISIYIHNDISEYKTECFDDEGIKKIINDNNNYHDLFVDSVIKQIMEILKDFINNDSSTKGDIYECFTKKFKECKYYWNIIYYKFNERLFNHFIKKEIKKKIVSNIIESEKEQ